MNELTAKFWPFVKVLFLPYMALLFLLFFPIDYYIDSPGGIAEVSKTIEVDYNNDKEITGSFSTTYIMALNRPSFFQFIVAYFNDYTDSGAMSGSYLDYTTPEMIKISYLDKETSVNAAIIVAYEALSPSNPEIQIAYDIKTLVFGKAPYLSHYEEIDFGDEFLYFVGDSGSPVFPVNEIRSGCDNDLNEDGILDNVCTTSDAIQMETIENDSYLFTFLNAEGQEYSVEMSRSLETGLFGITFKMYYLVNEEGTFPVFTQLPSAIGGPSGGLLSTLHVYNLLAEEDITHGLKIAGTGTINYDGSVGYIGGVRQKIITAYLNNVDVFFIPHLAEAYSDNYIEAVRACEELKIADYESWLIPVASLQDALDYLATRGD